MNLYKNIILSSALLVSSNQLLAHSVNTPHVFVSGTPALASEMNDNFTEIENAVGDNDARIVKLSTDGRVAVHANGFHVPDNQVGCTEDNSNYLFFSAGTTCNAYASISLPSNTVITGFACTVLDKDFNPGAEVSIALYRTDSQTGASEILFDTTPSLNDTNVQQINDNSSALTAVSNALYFYKLDAFFGAVNGGSNVRLYGCSVGYRHN